MEPCERYGATIRRLERCPPSLWEEGRYCRKCGQKLEKVNEKLNYYSDWNGKPYYIFDLRCPNYQWWHIFSFSHTNIRCCT